MGQTVTIPKTEYEQLHRIAKKYEMVRKVFSHDLFEEPDTRDIKRIIKDFRVTKLYNKSFLRSLEQGMKESDYFGKV